ncbi:MAG: hypothetical protein CHACPFDD_04069 [Phycisphaerae bacterium]|nr:hypothetical protein [Phycisphaerae bacterium]
MTQPVVRFAIVLLVCGAAAGCAPSSAPVFTQPRANIVSTLLRKDEPIVTRHILKLRVSFKANGLPCSFDALLGPRPFVFPVPDAIATYLNTQPRLSVSDGWLYLSGDWPTAVTDLVFAGAHGTTMIVQVESSTVHRVFLLRKSLTGSESCKVHLLANPSIAREWRADRDRYVETTSGGTDLSQPLPVDSAPQAVQDFLNYVKSVVEDAHMP